MVGRADLVPTWDSVRLDASLVDNDPIIRQLAAQGDRIAAEVGLGLGHSADNDNDGDGDGDSDSEAEDAYYARARHDDSHSGDDDDGDDMSVVDQHRLAVAASIDVDNLDRDNGLELDLQALTQRVVSGNWPELSASVDTGT